MSSTTNHNDNNNGGSGKGWRALHSPENRPPHEESNGSSSSSSSPSCNHNAFIRAIHAMSSSYFNGELRQAMAGAKEETKAFIRREFAAEREKVISVLDDAWQRFSLAVVNEQVELAFAKMTAQMETANEDIFRRALATDGVGSAFLRELTQAATCEVVLTQAQAQAEAEVGVKNLERAQQLYHLRARTFDKARARAEEAAAAQQQKRKAEEMEEEQEEDEEDDIRSIPGTPPPPRQPPPLILSLPPTTSLKALEQLPASKSNRPLSNEEQRGGIFPFSLSSADPLLPSTSFLAFKSATSTGGGGGATKTASTTTTTTTKKPRTKKLTTLDDVAEALEAMEASSSSSSPISVPVVKGQLNKSKKLAVEQQQKQKPLPPLFKAENSSNSNSSVQSVPVVPKISASASSSSSASLFQASTVVVSPSPSIGQVCQVLHPHRPRTPRPPKVHRTLLMACAQPSCGRLLPPGLELTTHQLAAHGLGPYVCYAPHCLLGGDVRVSFDQPHNMSVHIQALHSNKTLPWACPLCWWALPREQRTAGRRPELAFKEYTTYATHIADYHVKGRYACRYPGCRFPPVDLVHKVREHYALVHGGGGGGSGSVGGSGSGSGSVAAIAGPALGKAQVKVEVKVEAEEDEKKEVKPSEKPKDGGEKESAEKKPPPNKKPANKKGGKRSANKVVNSSGGPPVKSEDIAEDDGNGDDPLAATSSSPRAARLHARVIRFNKVGANN